MVMDWNLIQKPDGFKIEQNEQETGYIKVSIEPLMRGYGNTVANTLRRILLSSIEGSAIYGFSINGFEHSLATRDGIYQDATQITLNLKAIRLSILEREVEVDIKRKGPVKIFAKDIEKENSAVKVINKDQLILEVTGNVDVDLTLYIKRGVGYELSDNIETEGKPINFIPVDALYSPITKVKYQIDEDIRYETKRDYERAVMEIWHDTSIDGENFIPFASKIAKDVFGALVNFDEEVGIIDSRGTDLNRKASEKLLDMSIDELNLSKRPTNCFREQNIKKIKQLVTMSRDELIKMKNLGSKSLQEIEEKLKLKDLYLGMNIKKRGE